MRSLQSVMLSLVVCTLASAQIAPFAFHFEFDQPNPLPTATTNVALGNLTGYSNSMLFATNCGVLEQRTGTNNIFGSFFYGGNFPGYPSTPVTLNPNLPVILEAHLRVVGLTPSGLTSIMGAIHGGNIQLNIDCSAGTIGLATNIGYAPVIVPGGIYVYHTYRVESYLSGPFTIVTLFVDGVQAGAPAIAPTTTGGANGWYFGDSSGGAQGADVDWQYATIANGLFGNVGQANSAAASLFVNRAGNTSQGAPGLRGPFIDVAPGNSTLTLEWNGPANQPFLLFVGPQNPGGATFGCSGTVDVGTPFSYNDITIVFNPFTPFIGSMFWLDNCGYSKQTLLVPPYLSGTPLGNLQGIVFQPASAPCPLVFTAAHYIQA